MLPKSRLVSQNPIVIICMGEFESIYVFMQLLPSDTKECIFTCKSMLLFLLTIVLASLDQ